MANLYAGDTIEWCQKFLVRSTTGRSLRSITARNLSIVKETCAIGAITYVRTLHLHKPFMLDAAYRARRWLTAVIEDDYDTSFETPAATIAWWNDNIAQNKGQVIKAFSKAAELAREQGD